jgi:hypothetical protein
VVEPCEDGVGGLEKCTVSSVYAEPLSALSIAGSSADLSESMTKGRERERGPALKMIPHSADVGSGQHDKRLVVRLLWPCLLVCDSREG